MRSRNRGEKGAGEVVGNRLLGESTTHVAWVGSLSLSLRVSLSLSLSASLSASTPLMPGRRSKDNVKHTTEYHTR